MFGAARLSWYDANVVSTPTRTAATITRTGSPVTSTTKIRLGTASGYFPATTDYLSTNNTKDRKSTRLNSSHT